MNNVFYEHNIKEVDQTIFKNKLYFPRGRRSARTFTREHEKELMDWLEEVLEEEKKKREFSHLSAGFGKNTLYKGLKQEMGEKFGDFVPVSSMIAEMVYSSQNINTKSNRNSVEIFRKVRLGAARQHLDYVLVYEVFSKTKTTKLASSVANWTIIGGYLIPSREIETTGHANALLLDVRTGYPYGTASASLDANEIAAWFNDRDKARNLADRNQIATVLKLIPEVQQMMMELMKKSQ